MAKFSGARSRALRQTSLTACGFAAIATLGAAGTFVSGALALGAMTPVAMLPPPSPLVACATCQLQGASLASMRFSSVGGQRAPGTAPSLPAAQLGASLTTLFNQPSLLGYPSIDTTGVAWDGQGDLPNAFRRPWVLPESRFDPSFRTAYWSEATGFEDVAGAPWRMGVTSGYGAQIFAYGVKNLGNYDYASLAPVYLPEPEGGSGAAL